MATQTPTVDVPQSFPSAMSDVDGLTAALAAKEATAAKGAASGYAPLDSGSKVPAANLPPASASAAGTQSSAHFNAVEALGTMSTQAANAVAVTGGTATGLTQLATTAACTALLGGATASAQSSLAISATKTIAVPAALSVWRGLDFQASTLTLTAGGVAPSSLSAAYFAAPVITQTAGAAYTVPAAATVTIAGPPAAGAGGGATPTITATAALVVASGYVGIGTAQPYRNVDVQSVAGAQAAIRFFQTAVGGGAVGLPAGSDVFWLNNTGYSEFYFGNPLYGIGIAASGSVGIGSSPTATSRLIVSDSKTIASAAGAVWDGVKFAASTLSVTGATGIATAAGFNFTTIQAPTIAGDTATCAIATAATLYVTAAPIAGANVTITAGQAIKVGAGSIVCQGAALATDATNGFLYIPTCAGTPNGTPTTQTGTIPIVYDTTNHKLYIYDGSWVGGTAPGAWS